MEMASMESPSAASSGDAEEAVGGLVEGFAVDSSVEGAGDGGAEEEGGRMRWVVEAGGAEEGRGVELGSGEVSGRAVVESGCSPSRLSMISTEPSSRPGGRMAGLFSSAITCSSKWTGSFRWKASVASKWPRFWLETRN